MVNTHVLRSPALDDSTKPVDYIHVSLLVIIIIIIVIYLLWASLGWHIQSLCQGVSLLSRGNNEPASTRILLVYQFNKLFLPGICPQPSQTGRVWSWRLPAGGRGTPRCRGRTRWRPLRSGGPPCAGARQPRSPRWVCPGPWSPRLLQCVLHCVTACGLDSSRVLPLRACVKLTIHIKYNANRQIQIILCISGKFPLHSEDTASSFSSIRLNQT